MVYSLFNLWSAGIVVLLLLPNILYYALRRGSAGISSPNRAINALWEHCCFAPSSRSQEDEAVNAAILDDLERAAKLDPSLPLPRAS